MTSKATDQSAKPSMLSGVIVSLMTVLLSLVLLEGVMRWVFTTPYQWDRRLTFFSEGRNFRNTDWGGFVYEPHEAVHARTYYITSLDSTAVRVEYDIKYTTNANGLVQLNDFTDSKPAIVFLGDSFTEGQGARPWFYELERDWPANAQHQIVNGGILGSGVEAWGRLYRKLSTEVKVAKVVIIFISDDWTRPVWQFPQQTLDCLNVGAKCKGSEDFYGLPEDPIEAQLQVDRIARYRVDYLSELRSNANVVTRSSLYQKLVSPTFRRLGGFAETGSFRNVAGRQLENSKIVVTRLVNELGRDNVLFMYLPQKSELESGPRGHGKQATDFILQNGFAFVDGRAKCGLAMRDYYQRDGHPNSQGYAKIKTCVQIAVEGAFAPL